MGISTDMFVKTYKINARAKDKTFEDFINKHIVRSYIGFMEKSVYCDTIVESTCYVEDSGRKIIRMDSPLRSIFFMIRLIDLYTDIDIDKSNVISEYDKLNEVGAVKTLIEAIPESEYAEFSTILNMKLDDIINNEYSVTAILYNLKEALNLSEDVADSVIEEIKNKIDINK